MVGADAPVGQGQHVSLVGQPFARQAWADEEEINAAVSVLFAVIMRPGDVARLPSGVWAGRVVAIAPSPEIPVWQGGRRW